MKKLSFFLVLLAGFVSTSVKASYMTLPPQNAVIFVERGIEFAIFPDGQFDFFYNPGGNFRNIPGHINYSYNSGYNYRPFVQHDDYGAVVQIENVPIFYDYYGRITHAGDVKIRYNAFGIVNRVGRMRVSFDSYGRISHTSGFINNYNRRYVYQPWHSNYVVPYANVAIVYNKPYRMNYHPARISYLNYRNQYSLYNNNTYIQNNFYRPGDNVVAYNKGYRDENSRKIRTANSAAAKPSVSRSNSREIRRATAPVTQQSNADNRRMESRASISENNEVTPLRSTRGNAASSSVKRQAIPSRVAPEPQLRRSSQTAPQAAKPEVKSNSARRTSRGRL